MDSILILTGIVCISVLGMFVLIQNYSHKNKLLKITEYSVNVAAAIDMSLPGLLEGMIEECFNDYKVMELAPLDEDYITDEREKEIINDLVKKVSDRLSPAMCDKLSLYYNISNIARIIADKIYIIVMNHVVEHNRLRTSADDK